MTFRVDDRRHVVGQFKIGDKAHAVTCVYFGGAPYPINDEERDVTIVSVNAEDDGFTCRGLTDCSPQRLLSFREQDLVPR